MPNDSGQNQALKTRFTQLWNHFLAPGSDLFHDLSIRQGLRIPNLVGSADIVREQSEPDSRVECRACLAGRPERSRRARLEFAFRPTAAGSISVVAAGNTSALRAVAEGSRHADSWYVQEVPDDGLSPARTSALNPMTRAFGVRTTSTLAEGRFFIGDPVTRPVVEEVAIDDKRVTVIHLVPERDLLSNGDLDRDPSRLRAFLGTLVVAANEAAEPTSITSITPDSAWSDSPRGNCLLTEQDLVELGRSARKPTDVGGAAICGLYFLLLTIHSVVWLGHARK